MGMFTADVFPYNCRLVKLVIARDILIFLYDTLAQQRFYSKLLCTLL